MLLTTAEAAQKYLDSVEALCVSDPELAVSLAHGWTDERLDALSLEALFLRLWKLRQEPERPGLRLARMMGEALEVRGGGLDVINPHEDMTAPPPAWPSTIDETTFRGLVVVAGDAKLGKSSLCIGSALEAAFGGTFVVYANAELDAPTLRSYIRRWMPDRAEREAALRHFLAYMVNPGVSTESIVQHVMCAIPRDADRVLFVLDSINTTAQLSGTNIGRGNYLAELGRLTLWAMQVRKLTNGEIGMMVVSEKNKLGGVMGAKLNYAADVIVNMSRGKMDGYVGFHVTDRYGRTGELIPKLFDWRTGRFLGASPEGSVVQNEPI